MELIFMGTGTSIGVPVIAFDDHDCDLRNPRNWRTRTSAHVIMDGCHIQIDAAPEFRLQCIWNNIRQIDFVILTHGHSDHILGMDDLRRFCDLHGGNVLEIFSSPEGLQRMKEVFSYAIRDAPHYRGYPAFRPEVMPACLDLECGKVYSTLLPHGHFQVLGLVFEEKSTGKRLAYYTDCNQATEEARKMAMEVDILVIDGLRHEPHPSHMSTSQAVELSHQLKAKQSYLTHMTHHVDYESFSKKLPHDVALAYDGLRVQVP